VNETLSSSAKGGISYSPECHFCPHVSVLFQPAVEDPQGCGPLVISSFLVFRHCLYQFLGILTNNYLIIDHMNALATSVVGGTISPSC